MSWARAAKTALFVFFCFSIGLEQRFWSSHVVPWLNPKTRAGIDLNAELERQQSHLESELQKLPPDSQNFFREIFLDSRQERMISPLLASAERMTFAAENDDQETRALAAERRYECFKIYENAVEKLLWAAGLGTIAWCMGVSFFGKQSLGERLGNLCLSLSHGWLFILSCLCALWAGLSLKNPWSALPLGFYLAPVAASAASVLPDSSDETVARVVSALTAPAVCWALSLLAASLA